MARYSETYKTAIINRILSPEKPSIRSVARENDIPIGTVLNCLKQRNISVEMTTEQKDTQTMIEDNTLSEQFTMILETASMTPEELNAYCRQKGIYPSDIEVWKQEMLENLDTQIRSI